MGTHDFSKLTVIMGQRAKEVEAAGPYIMRKLAQVGTDTIVDATPVDTTRAVSNWKTGITTPTGEGPPLVQSVKGSGASAARRLVKSNAASVFKAAEALKAEQVWLANYVPYIGILEYGSGTHRPHGMVNKGLQAMRAAAKTIRVLKP